MLTFPSDTPIDATVLAAGSNLFPGEIQDPCDNTRSGDYTESTQEPERRPSQSRRSAELVSFNPTSRLSPLSPSFRAITSTTDTSCPTVFSASSLSSSSLEGLVDTFCAELETGIENPQASDLGKDCNVELISGSRDAEDTQIEQCSAETFNSCPPPQDCPICNGICTVCQVPANFEFPMRHKLFELGHRALELEKMAPNKTLRKWMERLHYASYSWNTIEGHGDVCLLSWKSSRSHIHSGRGFGKPTIIREDFADSEEWTPSRYADLPELAFEGTEVDVKWHQQPQSERVSV